MISPTFTDTMPPRAALTLRCDRHLEGEKCGTEFVPREDYWTRLDLRHAAAQEAAWTRDEVGRDNCGGHRSVYAAQRMQAAADATYPELREDPAVTNPDLHIPDGVAA